MFVQFADATQTKVVSIFSGPQDEIEYPNQGVIEDTDARYLAFVNAPAWAAYQAGAQAELDASDRTVLRCYENSVTVPASWLAYRKALRAIISASSGDSTQPLPTKPAYPAGT